MVIHSGKSSGSQEVGTLHVTSRGLQCTKFASQTRELLANKRSVQTSPVLEKGRVWETKAEAGRGILDPIASPGLWSHEMLPPQCLTETTGMVQCGSHFQRFQFVRMGKVWWTVQFLVAGIYGGGHSCHSSGKERQKSLKGTLP